MTNQMTSERNSSAKPQILAAGCVSLCITGLLVALCVAKFQGPRGYLSTSRVLVTKARAGGLNLHDIGPEEIDLSSEILLIRSDEVIKSAIVMGKLDKLSSMKDEPASEIARGLRVEQIAGTDVIQIEFQSPDPRDVQAVVSAITDAYIQYRERQMEDTYSKPLAELNTFVTGTQRDLSQLEAELATARAGLREDSDEQLEKTQLSAFGAVVAELELKLTANRAKQSAIKKSLEGGAEEESKLQIVQEILELESPPVSVEASIVGLKGLEELMQIQLEELRAKLEAAKEARDKQLAVREKLQRLKESIDRKRELHSEAIQRLKDLNLVKSYKGTSFTVIAPASAGKRIQSSLSNLFGF